MSMDRIYVYIVSVYVLATRIVYGYVVDGRPYEYIDMTEVTWRVEDDAAIEIGDSEVNET